MIRCSKIRLAGAAGLALLGRLVVVTAVVLAPCVAIAGEARSSAGAPAPSGAAPSQLPRQEFPEPVLGSLRTALEAYEQVRGQLAADRLEGVPASASRLADALRLALEGRAGLEGEIPGVIEEAARIADSMAKPEGLEAARAAFGEVSRFVLLLASSDARLAEGWHVFACPMAKTFGKWVQPTETLDNPYMGLAMPACGSPADWSAPAPSSAKEARSSARETGTSGAKADAGEEPVFRPGIPGLKMVDVRDHKFLWREIEELQSWERGDRISIAEYRSKVIEKTAHFLGLEQAAADRFTAAASEAVATIRASFFKDRAVDEDSGGMETRQFSSDLNAAVTRLSSLLQGAPRHQLFAPECKKWLLKMAFGPSEAKEAREARKAQVDKAGKNSAP